MSIKGKVKKSMNGIIVLVGFLLSLTEVGAQENMKIGFVNVEQLLGQAPQTQAVMMALQEEFAPREREIVAMQQSLQGRGETLERDGAVMGEEERANLERDIRNEQRDLERSVNEFNEDFDIRRNEELALLQRLLLQEVQIFASSAGYDLLLSQAVFVSGTVNITEAVLRQLEESSAVSAAP